MGTSHHSHDNSSKFSTNKCIGKPPTTKGSIIILSEKSSIYQENERKESRESLQK